ncbi:MAG: methyltransferase domain-containing protein [Candidatus Omnitrophica bacterium]|nr:methyltransferase domain-containing protein [Candidatus Omnitrophota bacterium]MDD3274293.1 methyltransferase domain-containing protein [Candidatus Omnitrophota bacterium]MDD5078105.1 methyltransferase domain-containing protein [Candidatus Omnitrophota bacterium]MDD5724802.1 methyltransferase domain-containing protein [Candidatus Omnitrophota bacterium]
MSKEFSEKESNPLAHFVKRARNYNCSSGWVGDRLLIEKIRRLAESGNRGKVLDIAVGTGKISQDFLGRCGYVIGIDTCPQMARRAGGCADEILLACAERLPFRDNVFDACVCRQGMQFMDTGAVLAEIKRVLKPGGRVVLCHLAAYGESDKRTAFFIQKWRNPSRKNFFLPGDFKRLLRGQGFKSIESYDYITRESVHRWINNGAIGQKEKKKIIGAYRRAPGVFRKLHQVSFEDGDIFDSMKMVIVKARKGRSGE